MTGFVQFFLLIILPVAIFVYLVPPTQKWPKTVKNCSKLANFKGPYLETGIEIEKTERSIPPPCVSDSKTPTR